MEDVDVVIIGAGSAGLSPPGRCRLQPVAEKIFFAGEHLAGPLIQTCGGARLVR